MNKKYLTIKRLWDILAALGCMAVFFSFTAVACTPYKNRF
jgi:hypothetical protein